MLTIQNFSKQIPLHKPDQSFFFALELGKVYDDEGFETDSYRDYIFKCPLMSSLIKVSGNIEMIKIKPAEFQAFDLVSEGVLPIVYKLIKE